MRKPLGLLAAVVLAAAVVTGCGQSSEEKVNADAEQVIREGADNLKTEMDCVVAAHANHEDPEAC